MNKINENLERKDSRPVLYVSDGKLYLTDLLFKFYVNWKDGLKQ